MKVQVCEVCERQPATRLCDGCGRMLCPDCQVFEIWGSDPSEAQIKHFCPRCYTDCGVNPWIATDVAGGLGDLMGMVRKIEEGDKRLLIAF